MVIQYFGRGEVKVGQGDWSLSFADRALRVGGRDGFQIDGPGEYEINGTFIRGVATPGSEGHTNTAYSVLFDDIRLVHLGAMSGAIPAEAKEILSDADILFSPSAEYAAMLEPKILVPMYEAKGKDLPKPIDKLVLKRKDVEGKEGEVIPVISN